MVDVRCPLREQGKGIGPGQKKKQVLGRMMESQMDDTKIDAKMMDLEKKVPAVALSVEFNGNTFDVP